MIKIKATRITMKGNNSKKTLTEIDEILIDGYYYQPTWMKKEYVNNLINRGNDIYVNISPYPKLLAVETLTERYVKSTPNKNGYDNLLELPLKEQ